MYTNPIEVKLSDHFSVLETVEFDREQYEQGWHDRDAEIVRCKDCKWYKRKYPWNGHVYECSYLEFPMDDNDYCSLGERREDETD